MELQVLQGEFTVCQIADINQVDLSHENTFLSVTTDEISLVCESVHVPKNSTAVEPNWRALKVAGILDFGMVGVIAKISNILAEAKISLFVISTYNTDYILIKQDSFEAVIGELSNKGYVIK